MEWRVTCPALLRQRAQQNKPALESRRVCTRSDAQSGQFEHVWKKKKNKSAITLLSYRSIGFTLTLHSAARALVTCAALLWGRLRQKQKSRQRVISGSVCRSDLRRRWDPAVTLATDCDARAASCVWRVLSWTLDSVLLRRCGCKMSSISSRNH